MYIRQVKKQRSSNAQVFYQYTLVQSVRSEGKVKQHIILYLGSDALLADKANRAVLVLLLKERIFHNSIDTGLFRPDFDIRIVALADKYYEKYRIKYNIEPGTEHDPFQMPPIPPDSKKANYEQIDVDSVDVSDVKTCGNEMLTKQMLSRLDIDGYLRQLEWSKSDRELALISIASRAIFSASEYSTCAYLKDNSNLIKLLSEEHESVSHKQLYRISDKLYDHKQELDQYLYGKICNLFNLEDKLVIFDLSNTYFESRKQGSKIAQYGRSKEKRKDCKLVVFSGVINASGFIRHSRIYEGNKVDTKTIEDMLSDLEKYSSKRSDKTVVIDAGIATEDNLGLITEKGYKYVCVARSRPGKYDLVDNSKVVHQTTDHGKKSIELKILDKGEQRKDTWMYVKSEAKQIKEDSMEEKLTARFIEQLEEISKGIHKKGGTKNLEKVWVRVGRAIQKYPSIANHYQIEVIEKKNDKTTKRNASQASDIVWKQKSINQSKTNGVYFIRTTIEQIDESSVWNIYNTIREVENTFRCLKSQLNIRPVHHQLDSRIESHIYLTLLAYQLVNSIRHQLKEHQINHDWSNIVRIMNTHTIQTIALPTQTKTIYIRKPGKPIEQVKKIYSICGCLNTESVIDKYVVYH